MSNFCNVSLKKKKYTNKDGGNLTNLGKHLLREQKEEYQFSDGTHEENNEVLISMSEPNLKASVDKFISDNNLKVRNSRTIMACQFVFSIPSELKEDKNKIEEFKKQTLEFLNTDEKFKGNVLLAVYHGDEKQPHIQILTIPKQNGKLCFQEMFGGFPDGATKLSKLQDDFAKYMKPLGLVRGDGTHTNGLDHKEYLAVIDDINRAIEPRRSIPKVEPTINPFKTIKQQENRLEALETENKKFKDAYKKSVFLDKQNEKLKQVNSVLKNNNHKITEKNMKMEEQKLEQIRAIDCKDVMKELGFQAKKDDKSKFTSSDFNISISKDNRFFDNVSNKGGFGAIDLLRQIANYSFKQAIDFLSERFGTEKTADVLLADKKTTNIILQNEIKILNSTLPKPYPKNTDNIKKYLIEKRKIKEEIVNELISKDLIYSDNKNNCVFVNEDKTFSFSRGTYGEENKFKMCNGKLDFIKYDFNSSKTNEIYLFESTIDALSFRSLNPDKDGIYVSLNGNALINHIQELNLDSFSKVNLCFDNDEQGNKFSNAVKEITISKCETHKPKYGKDFNEELKNGYIYSNLSKISDRKKLEDKKAIEEKTEKTKQNLNRPRFR